MVLQLHTPGAGVLPVHEPPPPLEPEDDPLLDEVVRPPASGCTGSQTSVSGKPFTQVRLEPQVLHLKHPPELNHWTSSLVHPVIGICWSHPATRLAKIWLHAAPGNQDAAGSHGLVLSCCHWYCGQVPM